MKNIISGISKVTTNLIKTIKHIKNYTESDILKIISINRNISTSVKAEIMNILLSDEDIISYYEKKTWILTPYFMNFDFYDSLLFFKRYLTSVDKINTQQFDFLKEYSGYVYYLEKIGNKYTLFLDEWWFRRTPLERTDNIDRFIDWLKNTYKLIHIPILKARGSNL